jgi:hypothetical protein
MNEALIPDRGARLSAGAKAATCHNWTFRRPILNHLAMPALPPIVLQNDFEHVGAKY